MNNPSDYDLNDLPRYSDWPAKLLGIKPCQNRRKTTDEVVREYEMEKWGPLLRKVQQSDAKLKVEEVDSMVLEGESPSLCSMGDKFQLLSPLEGRKFHIDLVESAIKEFLPVTRIVELGAGYGSVVLTLAKRHVFAKYAFMAAEYVQSGIELIKLLSKNEALDVDVGHSDFNSLPITDLTIPDGALIYTSMATPCIPYLSSQFITSLLSFKPKVVIHIEPCYEHCDNSTLLGMLRQRYIEVNDYNCNLVTRLHEHQNLGSIKILYEKRAVFGYNPLLSVSLIAWSPA